MGSSNGGPHQAVVPGDHDDSMGLALDAVRDGGLDDPAQVLGKFIPGMQPCSGYTHLHRPFPRTETRGLRHGPGELAIGGLLFELQLGQVDPREGPCRAQGKRMMVVVPCLGEGRYALGGGRCLLTDPQLVQAT